ncbi:MAG TPA: oxygen-insensitive NADPH nitroreductase [Paenibacillaceae bacterium]
MDGQQKITSETIGVMMRHRSIRRFKPDPVPEEVLETIVRAAQMASTSSNTQSYSVIAVTDAELKRRLADVADRQDFIAQCPLFLVWCADLYRNRVACEKHGVEIVAWTTENFLMASVDTALAAQNAALAAESLGLGIVFIGGLRSGVREATRLLKLPPLVYPVFGMCVGYPDQDPGLRPRLPLEAILHRNEYDPGKAEKGIEAYDEVMHRYYLERTGGRRDTTWSKEMAAKFVRPRRAHLREYLEEQGFLLK